MKPPTNSDQLSKMVIEGFKSIAACELELGALNILIGCNGAGKSNFIGFFQMIRQMLDENLQLYVSRQGGPDAILHFGRKTTEQLKVKLFFGNTFYWATFGATQDNRLMFENESFGWNMSGPRPIGSGHFESRAKIGTAINPYVPPCMKRWQVYHFHDTGDSARVKQPHGINDNSYLRADARNLAAFLYLLKNKYETCYSRIVKTVRMVAPFFRDFQLRVSPQNMEMIELEWVEKGYDTPFKASHFSDGTLRFICLATVFLQPEELQPATILVDEPELGLHPYAVTVLASLMKSVAQKKQVIVSTQSVDLLNEFDPEDIVVVDRNDGRTSLRRIVDKELEGWLNDYTLGELWNKNIFGGRPAR